MNLLTSREVPQEPVDDLWTNLLSNLPGGSQKPQFQTPLTGKPPDLLTSLPNGRSDRKCPGGLKPPESTTQEPTGTPSFQFAAGTNHHHHRKEHQNEQQ